MDDDVDVIEQALSRLIIAQLKGVASRQYFPTVDADSDDDRIAKGKKNAEKLRKLRDEFESLVTGII